MTPPLAYFVSSHGFGHAARASAVMAQLRRLRPELGLHVFTSVPRWFFDDSLREPFTYHPLQTDVGLEQSHPFEEDLAATVASLAELWGGMPAVAAGVAKVLSRQGVGLVACDISPLGLAVAERAGLPRVLIENFTWDWIYRGFVGEEPRLGEYARRSAELFDRVDLRIQAEPVCDPKSDAVAVSPVGRRPHSSRAEIRSVLGLEPDDRRPLVLLTMGGMGWRATLGEELSERDPFLVTLGGVDAIRREPGRLALPDRSPIYPPDLVGAADLVVAKLGYSTVAECYQAGARLVYLERPRFVESPVLAEFARREMNATALDPHALEDGSWLDAIREALTGPRPQPRRSDGAGQVARLLLDRLG